MMGLSSFDGYVASPNFLCSSTWYSNDMSIGILHTADSYSAKVCSMVGTIRSTDLKMERHGDFDPSMDDAMENSHLSLTLEASEIPMFRSDFLRFHNHFQVLVDLLDYPTTTLYPFVSKQDMGDGIIFNFSHQLFQRKPVSNNSAQISLTLLNHFMTGNTGE